MEDKDLNLVTSAFWGGKTENEEGAGQPLLKRTSGNSLPRMDCMVTGLYYTIPHKYTPTAPKVPHTKRILPARDRGRWGNNKSLVVCFEGFCFFLRKSS